MNEKLKKMNKVSLTRKVLFVCTLVFVAIPFYFAARNLTSSNLIQKNNDELAEIVQYIDSSIQRKMLMLEQLIRDNDIASLLKDVSSIDYDSVKDLIETARADSGSDIVYIMDIAGKVVASTLYDGGKTLLGNNYAFREYFTEALKGGAVVFPAVGVTTDKRGLYISSRIYDVEEGRVLGVIVFKIGLEDIDRFLAKYDSPKMYVSGQGIVFATNDKEALYRSLKPLSQDTLNEIARSKQFAGNKIEPIKILPENGYIIYKEERCFSSKGETRIKGWDVVSLKKDSGGFFLTGYQSRIMFLLFCLIVIVLYFSICVHAFDLKEFALDKIRVKILVPVVFALFLVCFSSIWIFFLYHKGQINLDCKRTLREVGQEYALAIDQESDIISSYIDLIQNNKNLQKAYLEKDRKSLYDLSVNIFDELNKSYKITHFYFHDTKRNNFLRVHKPESFGDFIDRYTTAEAYHKGITKAGIELGPYGRLALRVVRPWVVNGELIGFIELGKEIDHILPNIAISKALEIMYFIEKDMVDKVQFLNGQQSFGDISDWDKYSNVILSGSTLTNTKEIDPYLNKEILSNRSNKYRLKIYKIKIDHKGYLALLLPLSDVRKREVGSILVLKNYDNENAAFMNLLMQAVQVELAAFILLGVFLWLFLGRIERSALGVTAKLEANIRDLEMVSTILLDKESSLEREIAYRKNVQKDLVSAKEHAELLSSVVPVAIFTVDNEKRITGWNDFIEKLTGYSREEVLGKDCSFFAVAPCSNNCGLFNKNVPKPLVNRECTVNCKDGRLLKVSKNVDYIKNNDGEIIGGIECFEDVTERSEKDLQIAEAYREIEKSLAISESLREDLEEAQMQTIKAAQVKSDFLANMSHEMRTPMNAILGFSDLLRTLHLTEQQRNYVETIYSSGDLLIKIINDILDFSKLDSGMAKMENIDFNLQYLLNDVFKIASVRTKQSSVEVYIDIDPEVNFNLKGDPTRLRQIFLNLLSNAIKFTHKGSIGVIVEKEKSSATKGQTLRFIIKDTGIGIPQDKKEIIFESFAQGDTSTTRKYGGTGLGLTICRSIVMTMGGEIWVESKEGKGSEFVFVLDFEDGSPVENEDVSLVKNVDLSQKKVIILDDNEIARKIHTKCCESLGLDILSVNNSPKYALEKIKELLSNDVVPDLILCDLVMKDMDGFAFASEIRVNEKLKNVKMIAITGEPEIGGADNAQAKGFNGYLPKPATLDELKNVIRTVFGDKRVEKTIVTRHMAKELSCKGARVLVVEDSITNQMLMREYCHQLGCAGEFALSAYEAMDLLKSSKEYDIVLMDIQMNGMNGIEATKMIRKEISTTIPIIAFTAAVSDKDRDLAKEAGMNDFIVKPVSLAHLKEIISQYRRI